MTSQSQPAYLAGLAALAIVALVAGCSSPDDDAQGVPTQSRVEHVHGLGIDPADGTLYAATHFGLFRILDGRAAQRVGESRQDTMGFAVLGANQFLGSGHPDPGDEALPPLLGLIESIDAGREWTPVSLLGEADFHALVARHGLVYAYDATNGRFMVSSDRVAWDERSSLPRLISFAVDPSDPNRLLATTTSGLVASSDGGRSWTVAASPPLVLVSWANDGTLAAAAPAGSIYRSADGGANWTAVGTLPGPPETLLAIDDQTLAAAIAADGIYRSGDGGATWTPVSRDPRA